MAWGKAGSTTLTGAGDDINSGTMSVSKNNMFMAHEIVTSTSSRPELTFNGITTSTYARRTSNDGGADYTGAVNDNDIKLTDTGAIEDFQIAYFSNISGKEKLMIQWNCKNGSAGAGTAPNRYETVGKWTGTDLITSINIHNPSAGDMSIDSNLSVLGSDFTSSPPPNNVQDNSIFVEKDTAKRFWFEGVPTAPSNTADFDASSNDHIDIPTTGLTSLANGSVSFWLNTDTGTPNSGDNVVFSGSNSSTGSSEWVIGYYGGTNKISVLSRSGGNILAYQAGTLTKGAWYHIVYTNNSSTGNKLYIDGSVVTPSYTQGSSSTNSFMSAVSSINTYTIGANKDSGGYQWGFDGNIQQVLVYSSTLSQSEVTALYNGGKYGTPSTTDLLRKYELTSDANDTSGNGHNGTATGVTFTSEAIPQGTGTWKDKYGRESLGSWTPASLSNLHSWFDFSDATTITKDGSNRVSQVNDKSGNGNHLTQGTAGSQPLYVANDTEIGHGVLDTSGSRSMLDTFTAYSNQPTIASAMKYPEQGATDRRRMFWNTDDFSNRAMYEWQGNTDVIGVYGGNSVTFTDSSLRDKWATTIVQYGSSGKVHVNGVQKVTGNMGTQKPDSFRLGCDSDGTNYFVDTRFGEVIILDGVITDADRTNLQTYLDTKWGLS